MNITGSFVGYWNHDYLLGESIWSESYFNLFGTDRLNQNKFYNENDLKRIVSTIETINQRSERTYLVLNCKQPLSDIHILDLQPKYGEQLKLISIKIDAYRKPTWEDLLKDPLCHINIFSSIFNRKSDGLFIYDPSLKVLHSEFTDFIEPHSQNNNYITPFNLNLETNEFKIAFERTIEEKRFVITEVKNQDALNEPYILIYEPVLNQHNEVILVFLFTYKLENMTRANSFLLNQFLAIESAMDGIALLNEKGEYYFLNDSHVKMFGYETEEELLGKTWKAIYGPMEIERIENRLLPLLMEQGKWNGETQGVSKQGKTIHQEISLNVLPNGGMVCVCRDISQKKIIQKQLELSEERWKNAVEGSGAGIVELDVVSGKLWYSIKALQLLGYNDASQLNDSLNSFINLIHPDDKVAVLLKARKCFQNKIPFFEHEYRVLCNDQRYHWFYIHGVISRKDPSGNALAFIGSAYDITDRKNFEEKLKISEERWKFAIDGANAGIWDWNLLTNQAYYSDKAKELHGMQCPGNLFPSSVFFEEQVFKEDRPKLLKITEGLISGGVNHDELNYRIVHPSKGIRWVNDRAMVIRRNIEGVATRVIGIFFDITDKKIMEEKIIESEQRWIFALEGSSSGVWDFNLDSKEVFYSPKLKELLGLKIHESFEHYPGVWKELIHKDDFKNTGTELIKFLAGKITSFEKEFRVLHKDGTYHWFLNKAIIADRKENGKATRIIGTLADITIRKKNELELIKAKELAEASAKAKRTFLANMSHEIRTPMNAILGLSEQLSLSPLKEEQEFLVNIINDAAKSLKILIDDILDFSKIEEGKLQLEHIDFDLHEQLKRTNSMLLHKANEKNISIRLDFDWKIVPIVKGDPTRLSQILLNIVGNAIKFTQVGYVKVVCKLVEKSIGKQIIQIIVSDTGVGMNEESLKNLFKDFYQEDQSIARKYGGTGLGLSISRNLVTLMKGEIKIKSKKDFGTDVFISIPFDTSDKTVLSAQQEIIPIDKSLFTGRKILMVEDNKVNRIVANIVLKKMDVLVDEAENGRAALYMLEENNYDLILMDLQMPEMDGITATSIIRANGIRTPIIALTANAVQEELEELLTKGFNNYVVKPFEEKKLLLTMQEYLKNKSIELTNNKSKKNLLKNQTLKEILQKNSDLNSETEKLLANALKFELSSAIDILQKAIPLNDWNSVKKIAHKQKSMLLSLGIKDESETIISLSSLNIEQLDPIEVSLKSKALLLFFHSFYKKALEFYPDQSKVENEKIENHA